MFSGYNTNGFAHHRLQDALAIIADLGYRGVGLTLDHHVLNPYDLDEDQLATTAEFFRAKKLRCVIETGARFLLDPWRKHQPTLISPSEAEREKRLDFLRRAIDLARVLDADAVSFWSGASADYAFPNVLMTRLVSGCCKLADYAATQKVRLAFEPEPGMFIDTMARFAELHDRVNHPNLGLTIDIGHLHCQGETPIADHLRQWRDWLWNVHIEDMRRGVHEHLMFGEGEIDFKPVLQTLKEIGYTNGVYVELSRHSHDAVETARKALAFLQSV